MTDEQTTEKQKDAGETIGKLVGGGIIILIVWFLWSFFSSSGPSIASTPSTTTVATPVVQSDSQSSAYKLAVYDSHPNPNIATVAQYQSALNALKPLCTENESALAGEIWASWSNLESNGVTDETILSLMSHIQDSIPKSMGPTNCKGVMAAYLVLREPQP